MAGRMQFLRHVRASIPALALVTLTGGSSVAVLSTAQTSASQTTSDPATAPVPRAVLDQYCILCHNQRLRPEG